MALTAEEWEYLAEMLESAVPNPNATHPGAARTMEDIDRKVETFRRLAEIRRALGEEAAR